MSGWLFPRTLRARLTVSHMVAMLVVLIVYAIAVFTLAMRNASAGLNDQLRNDFRWAAEMAQQGPDGELTWFEGDEWEENRPWLKVTNADGKSVFLTSLAKRLPVAESTELARHANGSITAVPHDFAPFRILSGHATIASQPVVIQVGRSEILMREELAELLLVLALGLPLSVGVTGLVGYWLARGALAPLDRMAERARAITAERLGERLPIENPQDELGRLATAFNALLGRLESSFEQMRRFTSDVSHELRTPLTAIRSIGEIALREPRNEADYRTVVGSMLEDTNRLADLVDRLLMLSRADIGEVKLAADVVDLDQLAESVAADLRVLAEEKNQSISIEQLEPVQCVADRLVLRQAVINLVDNAIKYTTRGGQINLRTSVASRHATLEVSDNGPGIPAERRAHVFERFYRGTHQHSRKMGTGLGLAIAKWAVEANGGELTYEQVSRGGSRFLMVLPAESIPAKTPATTDVPPASSSRRATQTA